MDHIPTSASQGTANFLLIHGTRCIIPKQRNETRDIEVFWLKRARSLQEVGETAVVIKGLCALGLSAPC